MMALAMMSLKSHLFFVLIALIIAIVFSAIHWLIGLYRRQRDIAQHGGELGEPFLAEVLLDGVPVATISERRHISA